MTNTRPDFSLNPLNALAVAYNQVALSLGRPEVKKFADKPTAVKRLNAIVDDAEAQNMTVVFFPNGAVKYVVDNARTEAAKVHEAPVVEPMAEAKPAKVHDRGARTPLALESVIEILVPNPKREGSRSHAIFELYRPGMTGQQFLDAMEAAGHGRRLGLSTLNWDLDHGFINLA